MKTEARVTYLDTFEKLGWAENSLEYSFDKSQR